MPATNVQHENFKMPWLFFQNFTWFLEVNERSSLEKMVSHDKWAQVHKET
jgi:hypothetical protein